MTDPSDGFFFPNGLGRIMLFAFEEVLGKNGLNSVLNLSSLSSLIDNYPPDDDVRAVPFESISLLQSSLELGYGPHSGRGLALRAGRVFFSQVVRAYGSRLGLNDPAFRLQPPDLKLFFVLHALSDFFNQNTDQIVFLKESEHKIFWQITQCPWCWGRHGAEPLCRFVVGMLQEALYWVSGGKFYNVMEETCISQGDSACLIVIDRAPST